MGHRAISKSSLIDGTFLNLRVSTGAPTFAGFERWDSTIHSSLGFWCPAVELPHSSQHREWATCPLPLKPKSGLNGPPRPLPLKPKAGLNGPPAVGYFSRMWMVAVARATAYGLICV